MEDADALKKYNELYLEIIMQNKEKIEEGQNLYVAELPKLVTPNDDSVSAKSKGIASRFQSYNYDNDFYNAAKNAYEYVKSLKTVELPIQYWLKPSQTIKYGAGDVVDKAVLLCSLLIALGNVSARLVIVINEKEERTIAVYCSFNDRIIAMDLDKGISEFASKEELIKSLGVVGSGADITAYEFNDRMYANLA